MATLSAATLIASRSLGPRYHQYNGEFLFHLDGYDVWRFTTYDGAVHAGHGWYWSDSVAISHIFALAAEL